MVRCQLESIRLKLGKDSLHPSSQIYKKEDSNKIPKGGGGERRKKIQ